MKNKSNRRVVITGVGILSSVGIGKEQFWEAIKNGRSGIKAITLFNTEGFPVRIAGEVTNFDPQNFVPYELARRMDRYCLLGMAATKMALMDANLPLRFETPEEADRSCIVIGTAVGAFPHAEEIHSLFIEKGIRRIPPFFSATILPTSCATQIAMMVGASNYVMTISTACASGTSAIGEAFHLIRQGKFDLGIAGASEASISPLATAAFSSIGLLAAENGDPTKACRPFSKDRTGIVLAEGAAIVVLEELDHAVSRGARIYGEVTGYGHSFDCYHLIQPFPSGDQTARAMMKALEDASLKPTDVDYVNAHGSASIPNDKAETLAIKKAFGTHAYRLSISSTKSMIGHTLGACGALEFVACILMLDSQFLHPTINLRIRDPECDLDYIPNEGRSHAVRVILSTSSGFGGYNSACVIQRFESKSCR
jgi:3-oxoacyl-[acyl-carrier-protein] synthase II